MKVKIFVILKPALHIRMSRVESAFSFCQEKRIRKFEEKTAKREKCRKQRKERKTRGTNKWKELKRRE